MAWAVKGKALTRVSEDGSESFVIIELRCKSREEAEEVLQDRRRVYYDLEIIEINALKPI